MNHAILLSGPVGVGKSAVCARVVARAREAGLRVAGAISPPEIVDGEKVGIWAEDAGTGERRRLAVAAHLKTTSDVQTQRWTFNAEVLAWGAEVIARACPCDLLAIDELGPLELERGEGWVTALDVLRDGDYRWALVVVRANLVEAVQARLADVEGLEVHTVTVSEQNRDARPAEITGWILTHRQMTSTK